MKKVSQDDRLISGKLRGKAARGGGAVVAVDGVDYRWSRRHGWLTRDGRVKVVSLSIALRPERTRELILDFSVETRPDDPTPADARVERALPAAIRRALAAGWDPESRGRAFRMEIPDVD